MSLKDPHAPEPIQAPPPRTRRGLRFVVAFLLLAYFTAGIGYLVVRHWVWPRVDQWRPAIEARLAGEIGAPVRLGELVADFDRLNPRLMVHGAEIGAPGEPGLRLDRIEALLSWRSVLAMEPIFRLLRIEAPRLDVTRIDRTRFEVSGLVVDLDGAAHAADAGDSRLADWLASHGSIRIEGARLRYVDARTSTGAEFVDVDIAIDSRGRRHKLQASGRGEPSPAGAAPAPIGMFELVADLERMRGDGGWTGEAYASFEDADVLAINALAAVRSPLAGGRGRGRLWIELAGGRPVEAHGELDLAGPIVRTADGTGRLDVLAGRVAARWRDGDRLEITTEDVELVDSTGLAVDALAGRQTLVFDADWRLENARISLLAADATDLLELARAMPLPAALARRIDRWRVGGRIDGAALEWRAGGDAPDYAIDVRFSELALALGGSPRGGAAPGFEGLSGTARLDPAGGRLSLDGGGAVLRLPGLLEQDAIGLDRYDARIDWRRDQQLEVAIERFGFENADAAGEVHGTWRAAAAGPGVVDLEARLERADGTKAWRYLPLRLNERARRWVRESIQAAAARDARLRLRGDLADFPFVDPATGEFLVTASVASGRLAFDEDWPPIEAVEGRLRFERASMTFDGDASMFDLALRKIAARIDNLDKAVLRVEGRAEGPLADMVRVLAESPLREQAGAGLERLRFTGPASAGLRLELPISDIDASRVEGSVRFAGNRFEPLADLPPFEKLRGEIGFTRDGIRFEGLRAEWLGGEIVASGDGRGDVLTIEGEGRATAAGLARLVPPRFAPAISGGFDYRGELRFDRDGARIGINSDLAGLGVDLPAPLDKPQGALRPARLELQPAEGRRGTQRVRLLVGATGAEGIELLAETGGPAAPRLALGVGIEPALPEAGFALRLRMAELDVDRWREFLDAGVDPLSGPDELPRPDRLSMRVDAARIARKSIEDLEIEARRQEGAWTARVHSRQADGELEWREADDAEPGGVLVARFSRLEIPENEADDFGSLLGEAPHTLPALDVRADRFTLGAMDLGALELSARQADQDRFGDWLIDRLVLEHAAGRLEATGRWSAATTPANEPTAAPARTVALDFGLTVGNAGRLLGALGFPDMVRGGSGDFSGGVSWQGSPLAIDLPTLTGELRLDIGKGQFLRTEPGIAKLIGVLNLQSLPRRLNFDFRDVFAQGFAFDEIRGGAALLRGVARTEDLVMNGLQARVNLRGEVDLVRETQSLVVAVQPQVDAGLASLAYAAMVNPAVGIGSFVAQWMLQKPLANILATEFEVEGDWSDPQVRQRGRETPAEPAAPDSLMLQ